MAIASDILTTAPNIRLQNVSQSMQVVAQKHGVSIWRQLIGIVRLRFGPGQLSPFEYYSQHMYRKTLSWAEKRSYIGESKSHKLCYSLTAPEHAGSLGVLDDKPVLLALAEASDIPVTTTQAFHARTRRIGNWPYLRTAEEIGHFLLDSARYPLFCKPAAGRKAFGCVQIDGIDEHGNLILAGDATGPHAHAFAAEVVGKFPDGYLFQSCARFGPELSQLGPDALGPLRVITLFDTDEKPSVLLAYLRFSARGAVSGTGSSGVVVLALIDPQTGMITNSLLRDTATRPIETHPTTGQALRGFVIPQFREALDLAIRMHLLLPTIGIIGWDIALNTDGPCLIEGNGSPGMTDYQIMSGQGALNPDFAARFAAARARTNAISAAARAARQKWELGVIRDIVAIERARK